MQCGFCVSSFFEEAQGLCDTDTAICISSSFLLGEGVCIGFQCKNIWQFFCLLVGRLVCCLQFGAVENTAAVNTRTDVFVDVFSFLSGIAGSCVRAQLILTCFLSSGDLYSPTSNTWTVQLLHIFPDIKCDEVLSLLSVAEFSLLLFCWGFLHVCLWRISVCNFIFLWSFVRFWHKGWEVFPSLVSERVCVISFLF